MPTMTFSERADEITEEYWAARRTQPEDEAVATLIALLAEAEVELAEKENT